MLLPPRLSSPAQLPSNNGPTKPYLKGRNQLRAKNNRSIIDHKPMSRYQPTSLWASLGQPSLPPLFILFLANVNESFYKAIIQIKGQFHCRKKKKEVYIKGINLITTRGALLNSKTHTKIEEKKPSNKN